MQLQYLGVEGVWWSPRSSKPLRPDRVGLGGFDSHTLPYRVRRGWSRALLLVLVLVQVFSVPAHAQEATGARAGITPPPVTSPDLRRNAIQNTAESPLPPISPRRAFFASFLLPGSGQATLDRPYAGALFVTLEAVSLAMMHRSAEDMRLARRFRSDSMPRGYQINPQTGLVARDPAGNPIVSGWAGSPYTDDWVRTRRLHLEDWTAILIFNHLFAGADAFVAAQLWDLPTKVAIRQTPFGPIFAASWPFGRSPRR